MDSFILEEIAIQESYSWKTTKQNKTAKQKKIETDIFSSLSIHWLHMWVVWQMLRDWVAYGYLFSSVWTVGILGEAAKGASPMKAKSYT